MSHDTILLSYCHIHQLIIGINLNKVETFLQLSIKSPTEAITLLSVGISVITRILAQLIEGLSILHYYAGTLS